MKLFGLGRLAVAVSFLVLGACALATPQTGGYHLLKKLSFGAAEGGGEYYDYITIDADARRVYLTHGAEIIVLDADSFATVGKISGFKQIHGVALVSELGRGFVTDGGNNRTVIFDLKTLKTIGEVNTPGGPDDLLYDPASKHIFTFDGNSNDATAIDPANGTVLGTVSLGGSPETGVADGKGMIYDNTHSNEVVAFDSRTLQVKARWPVAPAGQPYSMAMDRQHRRLFIGARDPKLLIVMDADNGKIVGQQFPIGDRVDGTVYDTQTGLLANSTREGAIHIFHVDSPDKLSVVETVKTEFGARTIGLDPKTHNLYVDTTDFTPPAAPTEKQPNPQPQSIPGTFHVLIYGR
jgi:DNA-binding beta-propeller fold protein YncE